MFDNVVTMLKGEIGVLLRGSLAEAKDTLLVDLQTYGISVCRVENEINRFFSTELCNLFLNDEEKQEEPELPDNHLIAILTAIANLPVEFKPFVIKKLQQIFTLSVQVKIAQNFVEEVRPDYIDSKKTELKSVLQETVAIAEKSKHRATRNALLAIVNFGVMVAGIAIVVAATGALAPLGVGLALAGVVGCGLFAKKYIADKKDAELNAPFANVVSSYRRSLM